jgi:hypothetical protein
MEDAAQHLREGRISMKIINNLLLAAGLSAGLSLFAQNYTGANVTGQVVLTRTVNLLQKAQVLQAFSFGLPVPETKPPMPKRYPVPSFPAPLSLTRTAAALNLPSLAVSPAFSGTGFNGLTHADERLANNGNQYSHEPGNPAVAVANGFVLEGVNNAVMVYDTSGAKLLPKVVSTNELFGLAPAINRITGATGQDPTDMRVLYDQGSNRWFVLQESQDKAFGEFIGSSHLYLAVSQTGDPTGNYNIYIQDTTNASHLRCPCVADYPQLGADQNGIYISTDEYNAIGNPNFVDASLLAISKASLAAGATLPTSYQFIIPNSTGFEFAITPAVTPPGASYFLGNNGLQYFVSSPASSSTGAQLAIWAMTNTNSLATANPQPLLTQIKVPTLTFATPGPASQRPGRLTYGSTLFPKGQLAYIDGGDLRIQSVAYSGGRLYVTLNTQVNDENGSSVTGAAYFIFSPTFRAGVLAASAIRQGYLLVKNNNLLRASIAVNPQGKGAVAFTLVGPDYYPSSAFVPIDTFSTGSTVQIAAAGFEPEDGFTGYPDNGFPSVGIARWGDSSTAVAAADGSIWMATMFIPNAPRTEFANWGTFLERYVP